MKKGKVGRTTSGFRNVTVHAAEGKEFTGVEARSGKEETTDQVVLSGHSVDIKPKGSPLETSQVRRIRISDIESWLSPVEGESDELIVAEGVVVDLGKDTFICGPNGGILWESEKV
jgi:hypothetical protein